ncbi:trypsin 3A1-like [Bradysia coprophila]|uniref:trypsin 3A1-like n=1 Tax=Bradysia coprophila TaxID=38358 RepID=UPI00187DB91C|nr:trypsin 3A1-like [Bradysia coprophila]XP_037029862.1 trypsin 3A1-like [Bradysia coprophila]
MEPKLGVLSLLLTIFLFDWADSEGRIYGGYQVDITKAPWMVYIGIFFKKPSNSKALYTFCSGSILRPNLILTAAHCNKNETSGKLNSAKRYVVNVGSNLNDLSGGTHHSVKTVFIHPEYNGGGTYNFFHDVGLLELKTDIKLGDRAQLVTIALPDDNPKDGADVYITGYGRNPDHPGDNRLYQVQMNVITAEKCIELLARGTVEEVDQHEICVVGKNKNQCPGDSGGPLHDVCTGRQIGIASYGSTDCRNPKPSVLSRITDNLDFINRIIQKTSNTTADHKKHRDPQSVNPTSSMPDIRPIS